MNECPYYEPYVACKAQGGADECDGPYHCADSCIRFHRARADALAARVKEAEALLDRADQMIVLIVGEDEEPPLEALDWGHDLTGYRAKYPTED